MVDDAANREVIPTSGGRFSRRGRRIAIALTVLGTFLLIAVAGVAYAGYDFSRDYEGRILPGSTIAGVDVGGMSETQAVAAVEAAIEPQLTRPMTVKWHSRSWTATPKELGAKNDAGSVVQEALAESASQSFLDKTKMRLFGDRLHFSRDVAITYPRQGVRGFIKGIASSVDVSPIDASLDYSTGWVTIVPEKAGRKVLKAESRQNFMRALRDGSTTVELAVKPLAPEARTEDFSKVLLVHIGENKLYLYENGVITHTWTVATGQPAYPTPQGLFSIVEKRFEPTWINPQPDDWGKDLPASIPPGPGNPLGPRALNWSASGIRFHGTEATYSLGYNASHGCVRMSFEDVIQLYDLVEVGTPIVSIQTAPYKPLLVSTPDPVPVKGDANVGGKTGSKKGH